MDRNLAKNIRKPKTKVSFYSPKYLWGIIHQDVASWQLIFKRHAHDDAVASSISLAWD